MNLSLKERIEEMSITVEQKSKIVAELLNGTYVSIKEIVPVKHEMSKPTLVTNGVHIQYGVMIGITGDVKGQLVLEGSASVFGGIGEIMFGMPLEGEMLHSFSGELGNMIAGRLSTAIANKGINTDITSPTILQGDTKLLGHKQALSVRFVFESIGEMDIYLLLD